MIRDLIKTQISLAIGRLQASGSLPAGLDAPIEVADPRDPSHGDFACNYALVASKQAGMNPRELAEKLKEALLGNDERRTTNDEGGESSIFGSIEIAGPGFLNIRVTDEAWLAAVAWAIGRGGELAKPELPLDSPLRLNIEFVSVNPNGPITVGSGRGAAFGSTLANVMETVGHEVHREYYINDGTNSEQMRLFAETVHDYVRLSAGVPFDESIAPYRGDAAKQTSIAIAVKVIMESGVSVEQLERALADRNAAELGLSFVNILKEFDSLEEPALIKEEASIEGDWDGHDEVSADLSGREREIANLVLDLLVASRKDKWSGLSIDHKKKLFCHYCTLLFKTLNIWAYYEKDSSMEDFDTLCRWLQFPSDFDEDEEPWFRITVEAVDFDRISRGTSKSLSAHILDHIIRRNQVLLRNLAIELPSLVDLDPNFGEKLLNRLLGRREIAPHFPDGALFGDPERTEYEVDAEQAAHSLQSIDSSWLRSTATSLMIDYQRDDLLSFETKFDTWFSEQSLHDSGKVEESIKHLIANGAADEEPVRRKLKLAKGGKVEDVEVENQPGEEDDGTDDERQTTDDGESSIVNRQSSIHPTLWLRSTKFGDDMDRVLRRKDGRLTYIASDVAYHKDKFNRPANADKLITILGPDHHGYISRLHAVLAALELGENDERRTTNDGSHELDEIEGKLYDSVEERDACRAALQKAQNELEVIIFQIVRFVKEGKPAPMRKRDGNIYSLRDLMTEIGKDAAPHMSAEEQVVVGKDVARFFYLMRSHDTHMDFDIDLATKGTDENPVFYVQYAHARICSILRKAGEEINDKRGTINDDSDSNSSEIVNRQSSIVNQNLHPKEQALIKKVLDLPWEVQRCAEDYGVHRLTTYAIELARTFHHFYDACRVIQPEEPELTQRRLAICQATRHALQGALKILGVSAPEKMERADTSSAE